MTLASTNGIDLAKKIILEVDSKIEKVYWTNEQIEKYFTKRTVKEIIKQKSVFWMNPCSDLTLVTSKILQENKINHNWVLEEHLPTENFDFNRLHFALEFLYKEKLYFIDYKRLNEVYVNFGRYPERKGILSKQIIRFHYKKINFNKSLYKNIKESELNSKLKSFSLEKNTAKLKKDNSYENYETYKKTFKEKFIIKN